MGKRNPQDFNPRSPRGGATFTVEDFEKVIDKFQSTLPTRGSDALGVGVRVWAKRYFNPRSPRGGATREDIDKIYRYIFQSTLPTRGSDLLPQLWGENGRNFNPRSPRGGATALGITPRALSQNFNPRSPRGGATRTNSALCCSMLLFQSTLPTRGSDMLPP